MTRWLLGLSACLLPGCLLLVVKAPSSVAPDCESALCADGYSCDLERDECADDCSDDTGLPSSPPCQSGYTCTYAGCEPVCDDDDCDRGFICDQLSNECIDYCFDSDDCADEFRCCTTDRALDGKCEDIGDCYRP